MHKLLKVVFSVVCVKAGSVGLFYVHADLLRKCNIFRPYGNFIQFPDVFSLKHHFCPYGIGELAPVPSNFYELVYAVQA